MDNSRPNQENTNFSDSTAKIKESASDILHEGKKIANDLYQQGVNKVDEKVGDVEEKVQVLSDQLVKKIHSNPLSSMLVAVGVGMLLSSFFRKK